MLLPSRGSLDLLRSEDVKDCGPAGSRESRGDRDGILASTELARQSRDREGPRGLPSQHGDSCRYCGFARVTAAKRYR